MPEQTTSPSNFINEFETALAKLDAALAEARNAVAAIRSFVPQFAALAQVVATIESAVTEARHNIDATASPPPSGLRAVPIQEAQAVQPEQDQPAHTDVAQSPANECLRLNVTKHTGSLDLKSVDNALNEHTEIVDLALLDYDGRQATLKVWVSGPFDRESLQHSLNEDLVRAVGTDAEIKIEFDQDAAAA
jgi:hypothetical protein